MNQAFINASINGNLPILSNFDLSKISLHYVSLKMGHFRVTII